MTQLETLIEYLKAIVTRLDESPKVHFLIFATAWLITPLMCLPLFLLMLAGFYNFESLGMVKPKSWSRQIVLGLVLGLVVYAVRALLLSPLAVWVNSLIAGWPSIQTPSEMVEGNVMAYIGHVILAIVHAGFLEEFLFRGYLLNRTVDYLGNTPYRWPLAILAVSTLFGLWHFHFGFTGVIFSFIWFVITSFIYLAIKRNIWPMMISHAFADILTWTLAYLGWLTPFHRAVIGFYGIN